MLLLPGDAVEVLLDDGWWEGRVHITRDDSLSVFFPSEQGQPSVCHSPESHV